MSDSSTSVVIDLGERSYPVWIGPGELARVGERLAARVAGRRALIGTNPVVGEHYARPLQASLEAAGFTVAIAEIADGEAAKRLATVESFCDQAIAAGLDRRSVIIALGGGVTGDLVGYAAASLYRGVDFVQVPTTLMAMVDSSVGGKTGVNSRLGKNLIGAFWQPRLVCADLDTLATLPARELRCGLAEVVKHGCILDEAMFERLEREVGTAAGPYSLTAEVSLPTALIAWAVARSCELKGAVVAADEKESGQRAWLNFGHTFGHALEAVCGYGVLHHGEAVAIGMVLAAEIGVRRGDLTAADAGRLRALLERVGLPTSPPPGTSPEALWDTMHHDKKVRDGRLNLVLLRRLGEAMVCGETPPELVREVLAESTREA